MDKHNLVHPDVRMVLVPYIKHYHLKRVLWILLVASLFLGIGVLAGYRLALFDEANAVSQRATLKAKNAELETLIIELDQKAMELQDQLGILRHTANLERQASESVRNSNRQLQDQIAALEEKITFYKGVMVPRASANGLRIDKAIISATNNPRRFRYKVVLTQVSNNRSFLSGRVQINVSGAQNGEKKLLSVSTLSQDVSTKGIRFKFRYFQNLEGEMQLPDAFIPEYIQVIAQTAGRKTVRLEQKFDWILKEG